MLHETFKNHKVVMRHAGSKNLAHSELLTSGCMLPPVIDLVSSCHICGETHICNIYYILQAVNVQI